MLAMLLIFPYNYDTNLPIGTKETRWLAHVEDSDSLDEPIATLVCQGCVHQLIS